MFRCDVKSTFNEGQYWIWIGKTDSNDRRKLLWQEGQRVRFLMVLENGFLWYTCLLSIGIQTSVILERTVWEKSTRLIESNRAHWQINLVIRKYSASFHFGRRFYFKFLKNGGSRNGLLGVIIEKCFCKKSFSLL